MQALTSPDRTTFAGPAPRRNGFSLIELLVTVSFIAILASIALPRFPLVRQLATDAAVKSDLQNAMKVEEIYFADNGGYVAFAVANGGADEAMDFDASNGVSVTATLVGTGVRVVGSHSSSDNSWCISSESGKVVEGASC